MPMSAFRISRYVCVIGCRRPSGRAFTPGAVTSSVSAAKRACCAAAASSARRASSAVSSACLMRLASAPTAARSSLSSLPIVRRMAVRLPFLPSVATRSRSRSSAVPAPCSCASASARMFFRDSSTDIRQMLSFRVLKTKAPRPQGTKRRGTTLICPASTGPLAVTGSPGAGYCAKGARSPARFRSERPSLHACPASSKCGALCRRASPPVTRRTQRCLSIITAHTSIIVPPAPSCRQGLCGRCRPHPSGTPARRRQPTGPAPPGRDGRSDCPRRRR